MAHRWFRPLLVLVLCFASAFAFSQSDPKTEKAKIAKLEKSYVAAKSAVAKGKSDKNLKAYTVAALAYADAVMYAGSLPPKDKYPKSLKVYREVLTYDPKNKKAKENKEMIEQIYKSMGRPIPK